eukprot:CAMPEP_0202957114 /NCGR_PEP_ID=MMETSP1396-20130829/1551_1 /ASSEMBLY_ACC=CAM_ASM_000872 /TAXON_ID= /ORGANISM="Pseudokeronopsis sp., Strain Brazil" /LENGTH=110 /DNA_ID=CAMNT_0049674437 /DNA_START=322 /DNA_END=654 /DNA_ORIENTATION=-
MKTTTLVYGLVGIIGLVRRSQPLTDAYYMFKLLELFLVPSLSVGSVLDMCNSIVYSADCSDLFFAELIINAIRATYLGYSAYLVKSYLRRMKRGEIILATHGKDVVEIIE